MFTYDDIIIDEYGILNEEVEVSVYCLTYNHIDYIKNALDGFLNQKTAFSFQIIIFDDFSSDGTTDIVKSYVSKYPDLFFALIPRQNTYKHPERWKLSAKIKNEFMRGKYMALCEGDDYWIYEYKLQKQYDLLERQPDISLCVHNAIKHDQNGYVIGKEIDGLDNQYIDKEEILLSIHGYMPTASYFFRKKYIDYEETLFQKCPVGDHPTRAWLGYVGKVYFINEVWAIRNYGHELSWSHTIISDYKEKIKFNCKFLIYLDILKEKTQNYYVPYINTIINSYLYDTVSTCVCLEQKNECIDYCKEWTAHQYDELFDCTIAYLAYEERRTRDKLFLRLKEETKDNGVYIYGAGAEAKKANELLGQCGIDVKGFIVTDKTLQSEMVNGKEVFEFDNNSFSKNEHIYIGTKKVYRNDIFCMLYRYKYYNIW